MNTDKETTRENAEEATSTSNTKTYSQEEVDKIKADTYAAAQAKYEHRYEKKINNDYVAKEDFEKQSKELAELKSIIKMNQVNKLFLEKGGNKSAFDSYWKINKEELMKVSNDKINEFIDKTAKEQNYFFNDKTFVAFSRNDNGDKIDLSKETTAEYKNRVMKGNDKW